MDKEKIEVWLKTNSECHSRFLDLDNQLVATVYSLIGKFKDVKVIKLSEGKITMYGYYAEADFFMDDDIYTVRLYSEPDGSISFHTVYELIGYESAPKDGYPEYEIYKGTVSNDLIKAFAKYARKNTSNKGV